MGQILYLDEAGITNDEDADPFMIVAGVLVHTDRQWRAVRDAIQKVADDWLPPADRQRFNFHAKDLYHGSKYWDRDVWPSDIRNQILTELYKITEALALPVFVQFIDKKKFGVGVLEEDQLRYPRNGATMQGLCALDCIVWADRWLERFAPDENATVTAEDKADVREIVRAMHVILKDEQLMQLNGLGEVDGLPLKRIIDGVSFQRKSEAVALQLADVCAFILKRGLGDLHLPDGLYKSIMAATMLARGYSPDEIKAIVARAKESTKDSLP